MDEQSSDTEVAELVDELQRLRHGHGLRSASFTELPRLTERLAPGQDNFSAAITARERFVRWLESLGNAGDRPTGALLRVTFAHFDAGDASAAGTSAESWKDLLSANLDGRRRLFGSLLGIKPGALRAREDTELRRFARALVSGEYDPKAGPSYALETLSRDAWYIFDDGRVPAAIIESRTVVALRAGVDRVTIAWADTAQPPAELRFRHVAGGSLQDELSPFLYSRRFPLRFGSALQQHVPHSYAYVLEMANGGEPRPEFFHYPHQPTRRTRAGVQFAPNAVPRRVYRYGGPEDSFSFEEADEVELGLSNSIQVEFTDLVIGWNYGLTWQW